MMGVRTGDSDERMARLELTSIVQPVRSAGRLSILKARRTQREMQWSQ